MKKINYIFLVLITFCLLTFSAKAAPSYSFNVSSSSVENGKKVTASVTVKGTAAWNIKITSSGNTDGCTNQWADATENGNNTTKTFSTTCRASSLGTIAFVLSGQIVSSDETSVAISGSKRVNVVEPRKASTNNALKALSVEGYELTPAFDSEVLEYSVNVASEVNSVKLTGTKQDNYASVEGLGEKEVIEGANKFEVKVTAENGSVRTYNVIVNVVDNNPVTIKDGLTVVKNSKYVEIPEGYVEDKITVNGVEVPSFKNEVLNIVLIAVRDNQGNSYFYEVKDGNYYKFINLNGVSLVLYPQSFENFNLKGFEKTNITINNESIEAYKYKGLDNYYLIYARDLSNNEENIYMYDFKHDTYQVFNEELFNKLSKDNEMYLYILCGALGVIFLCIIIIIALSKSKKRRVKKDKKEGKIEETKEELLEDIKKDIKEEVKEEKLTDEDFEDLFEDIKESKIKKKKTKKEEDIDL